MYTKNLGVKVAARVVQSPEAFDPGLLREMCRFQFAQVKTEWLLLIQLMSYYRSRQLRVFQNNKERKRNKESYF